MSGMQGAFIKFLERRKRVIEGYESANPQVQTDVNDQDRQGTTCNDNTAEYTEGKKRRRIRKCYLCGLMTARLGMHMRRKHANLTVQERHEYREIMLRETPVLKANGDKKIKKLLKCPLCPVIAQRLDNHIAKIHGKKRGSKIMKSLIGKARELEGKRAAAAGESTSSLQKYHKKNITQEKTSNELHVGEEGVSRPAEETSRENMEEDKIEEDGTEADGTEANRTEEDEAGVDGTEANRKEDGTEVDGTEANRTEEDGTEVDGTEANRKEDGTEVDRIEANRIEDGTEVDGTEANRTEEDGMEVDGTEANRTEEDGTEVDWTEAKRIEEDGTEVDWSEANRTEEYGTEVDGTEASRTEEDGTEVDGTEANRTEEDGTDVDGTEANRTEEDGTEVDGTEANRTEEDGTEVDGTEANRIEEDGMEVDGTEANRTEEDGTEVDGTEANTTEEDGMEADRTIVGTEGKERTKQYSTREEQTDIILKDQAWGDGLDKDLCLEDRMEEAEDEEDHPSQDPQLFVHDVLQKEIQVKDKGHESANPQVQSDVNDQDRQGTTCNNDNIAEYTEGKKRRRIRKCYLCGNMTPRLGMHMSRKHSSLTLQERHEYREIMLRETPVLKANGDKKIKKLLKCPLCPAITQRLDNHIMNIHGKKRGSKIMKSLIGKARELEGKRAAAGESTSSLQVTQSGGGLEKVWDYVLNGL